MFVSTTRSSALLALLLLVSTLHIFSLATEQSSLEPLHSVLLHLPLMVDSNSLARTSNINPHFPASWLGKSLGDLPPDAAQCNETIYTNPEAANILSNCVNNSRPWYQQAKQAGASQDELNCKASDILAYCLNMVGCLACPKGQSGSLHDALKSILDSEAAACGEWASWYPPLKCLPTVTPDVEQCMNVLKQNSLAETCQADVQQKFANVKMEPTELLCEKAFELNKCFTVEACKYCPVQSADKWLNFTASVWSPKEAECTKWASDESKMECAAISSTEKPLVPSTLIPGTLIPSTPASYDACLSVLKKKGEVKRCVDEATLNFVKHPIENAVEGTCKVLYYISDCEMKAACALCSVTPDFTAKARKLLDAASELANCNQWSSDKPKLECTTSSSNTLLIVGIIIGVILILVVIGAVVIYCVCFSSSDKSGRSSKAGGGGGRGSGRRSKVNSRIAGSTIGSKQQNSRVSGGAKPQSRVSGGGKQRSRVSGGAKQQSRAKQSSTAY